MSNPTPQLCRVHNIAGCTICTPAQPPIPGSEGPHRHRKGHKVRNTVCGVVGVIVAASVIGGIAGSGGGSSDDPTPAEVSTEVQDTSSAPAPVTVPSEHSAVSHDPAQEITILPGTCKVDPVIGWPTVKVRAVNPTSDDSSFTATVVFSSPGGTVQYSTGLFIVDHVANGVQRTQDVTGFDTVPAGTPIKCTLTDQARHASY